MFIEKGEVQLFCRERVMKSQKKVALVGDVMVIFRAKCNNVP